MKRILIPIFEKRVSPRLDLTKKIAIYSVDESGKVLEKEIVNMVYNNKLERINKIIELKPDVIICDGLSELCENEINESGTELIAWQQGNVDEVLENYIKNKFNNGNK